MRRHSWEKILNYSKCCQESRRSHIEANVWYHRAVGDWLTRTKSMAWTKFNGKSILGHVCHWLVMKQSSVSNAQKSMSSQILCCASEGFFNIPIPTKLGRTELQEPDPRKATEIMMLSMESRLSSSGTSSKDSQRCSSVIKSMIYWATWDKHQKLSQEEFHLCQCSLTSPVTEKATKMNAWQLPKQWKYLREDLVLDNVFYWTRFWKEVVFFRE